MPVRRSRPAPPRRLEPTAATAAERTRPVRGRARRSLQRGRQTRPRHRRRDRRHGDWLLVEAKTGYHSGRNKAWEQKRNYPADNNSPVELYNLATDLSQTNDLAAKHPEKISELIALLKTIRTRGHSAPRLAR